MAQISEGRCNAAVVGAAIGGALAGIKIGADIGKFFGPDGAIVGAIVFGIAGAVGAAYAAYGTARSCDEKDQPAKNGKGVGLSIAWGLVAGGIVLTLGEGAPVLRTIGIFAWIIGVATQLI